MSVRTYLTLTAPEVEGEASQTFHTIVLNTGEYFTKKLLVEHLPAYYIIMAEELARRQDITAEQFMSQILSEGLLEAFMEVDAQKREAERLRRGVELLREYEANRDYPVLPNDDDIPF